jgi:ABC-2 type transport system ATP-binding protein
LEGYVSPAVLAEGLHKKYRETKALDGFDLVVEEGTVCGLLGPNGAGKTTAVRILSTLLDFDHGRAEVAGFDVVSQASEVRYRIGLNSQETAIDEILTARDNLVMFGRLYHLSAKVAKRRADELLEQFGLTDAANKTPKQYSGGMRRRLDLAASLIMSPPVIFLDEPTTGLDPRNRNEVWEALRSLVAGGTTLLLTTQYLEEADQLASQIVVIDTGKVIAEGTPAQLKAQIGGDQIDVVLHDMADLGKATAIMEQIAGGTAEIDEDNRRISVPVSNRVAALSNVARALEDSSIDAEDIGLRKPTLDEVFLRLTGQKVAA